ncbi:18526_t:CDS:1, partial [Funneliformis geosporum]
SNLAVTSPELVSGKLRLPAILFPANKAFKRVISFWIAVPSIAQAARVLSSVSRAVCKAVKAVTLARLLSSVASTCVITV